MLTIFIYYMINTVRQATHQRDHAQEYFKGLGLKSARANLSITFFCGGAASFHTPILHAVSLPSGGSLLLLRDFTNATLHANLQLAVTQRKSICLVITLLCWINDLRYAGTGRNGVFDIRTSDSVQLTRIIGPSSPAPKFDPAGEIPSGN